MGKFGAVTLNNFLTGSGRFLITQTHQAGACCVSYERFDIRRGGGGFFPGKRPVRAVLRKIIGQIMGGIIISLIAFVLFVYLLTAMLYPEKF